MEVNNIIGNHIIFEKKGVGEHSVQDLRDAVINFIITFKFSYPIKGIIISINKILNGEALN